MSLFLSFVEPRVTVDEMECAFDETFGATVMVYFSNEKTNSFGKRYKTGYVTVLGNTDQMRHFIKEIARNGSNTFIFDNTNYTVRMDAHAPTAPPTKFVPFIA